jgi:hypothetical protein
MIIMSSKECRCFDVNKKEWINLEDNVPMYLIEIHYEGEYTLQLNGDTPFWRFKNGHYVVKTNSMYLVIDEKDWNAFIINIDMQNNSNSEPHDLLKVGI